CVPSSPLNAVEMSAHAKPFRSAAQQIILFQAAITAAEAATPSAVSCPGQPFQSLYRLIVRRIVGLPARNSAMRWNTASYFGVYRLTSVAKQSAVYFDQSMSSPLAPSQASSSTFHGMSLWAMPTMIASASESSLARPIGAPSTGSWSSNPWTLRLLCCDTLRTATLLPVALSRAVAYRRTNLVQSGQSSLL